jgi:ketosteroid isomerase-like protein
MEPDAIRGRLHKITMELQRGFATWAGWARIDRQETRHDMTVRRSGYASVRMLSALIFLCVATALSACGNVNESVDAQAQAALTREITDAISRYAKAANDADEAAARDLWASPDLVSYVNPMMRLKSMDELLGFWQFLKTTYRTRELKPSNIVVQGKADIAWAVFDWEFTATDAAGKVTTTRGWETQVYQNTDRGWRLRHTHYSAPAAPPPQ